jgi:hypothetical protein
VFAPIVTAATPVTALRIMVAQMIVVDSSMRDAPYISAQ